GCPAGDGQPRALPARARRGDRSGRERQEGGRRHAGPADRAGAGTSPHKRRDGRVRAVARRRDGRRRHVVRAAGRGGGGVGGRGSAAPRRRGPAPLCPRQLGPKRGGPVDAGPRRLGDATVKVLVIDVGGTHVKLLATGRRTPVKFVSGAHLTPAVMVRDTL